jgi:tetratricopeptide (TPR) repeat protein
VYQRAQVVDRMGQQVAGMSQLAMVLAGVDTGVGVIEADLARLLAVADRTLPAIVEHLALVAKRLTGLDQMLASPKETAAAELFRSGSYALTSATELSHNSPELAAEWLIEAIADLSRAVETYPYHSESWFHLGVAFQQRGSDEEAADAFARCARYSIIEMPAFAAGALLIAAPLYRQIGQHDKARDLLIRFLGPLERCAEIHLTLAVHHGQPDRLEQALKLAPLLAADALAEGVTSAHSSAVSLCQDHDGPVNRLRCLEQALHELGAQVDALQLEDVSALPDLLTWPDPGVDALLRAEADLPVMVEQAKRLSTEVAAAVQRLDEAARAAGMRAKRARDDMVLAFNRLGGEAFNRCIGRRLDTFIVLALDPDFTYHPARAWVTGEGTVDWSVWEIDEDRHRIWVIFDSSKDSPVEVMLQVPPATSGSRRIRTYGKSVKEVICDDHIFLLQIDRREHLDQPPEGERLQDEIRQRVFDRWQIQAEIANSPEWQVQEQRKIFQRAEREAPEASARFRCAGDATRVPVQTLALAVDAATASRNRIVPTLRPKSHS